MTQKIITHSIVETQKIAQNLAQKYQNGAIIALSGPLGAGKTTFVQGFTKALKIKQRIISPTFILMREYNIPNYREGKLYHIDLYRLEKDIEIKMLGLEEIMNNPHNIILIEWAEKLTSLSSYQTVKISLQPVTEKERQIIIED